MANNLFGTDGIRCTVGQFPLDVKTVITLGRAIGQWAEKKYGKTPTVLVGHDTRESCALLKAALKTGMLLRPVTIYDAQVLPTPAVFNIINRQPEFDFGIIISASHNPYQDNGIKIVDAQHGKLNLQDELALSQNFYEEQKKTNPYSYTNLGRDNSLHKAEQLYMDDVLSYFRPFFLEGKTVVLDCANGATTSVAPRIFEQLGAHVIALHNTPTGTNINNNCGSTAPESLKRAMLEQNADIGFAFDGDGDRLVVVNKNGVVKNGDEIIALLAGHPTYKNCTTVVGTIMSNRGLELFLEKQGRRLVRTAVGDKFVAQALAQENMLLGGEQSGHIIANDYLSTGDGIFAALRVAQTALANKNWNLTTFERYPQVTINVPVSEKKDLNQQPLAQIIAKSNEELQGGRLVVRYSGTEPILRVMVEEATHDAAHRLCATLSEKLHKELS